MTIKLGLVAALQAATKPRHPLYVISTMPPASF